MKLADPWIAYVSEAATRAEWVQAEFACRFYGFQLRLATPRLAAGASLPALILVPAAELANHPEYVWRDFRAQTERAGVPLAVIALRPGCDLGRLESLTGQGQIQIAAADPGAGVEVPSDDPADPGYPLRGLRLPLGEGPAYGLQIGDNLAAKTLVTVGASGEKSQPALLRWGEGGSRRYLLSALSEPANWEFQRSSIGTLVPLLLLLRDAGGPLCWEPAGCLANLTIDDPWLIEPYGSLSYPGLLAEMRRQPFHATIGFVPWNFDRNSPEVIALFKANPDCFSIAVHGNNHDRYEFYRYENRLGDNQRAKPLAAQAFNLRQAMARMDLFRQRTGLDFDRVMVFPHGVCPAPTFELLKKSGFWATSNYSNVPLGERPSSDPAVTLRAVNAEWNDFPALRRNYPQNLSEEAIAIDLFLGNPVLFMAHQDLFFNGIDAFTPYARRVAQRQPGVRWVSLGELSRRLHLRRWLGAEFCEVRMMSRHAQIENPKSAPVRFHFAKREREKSLVEAVTIDGAEVAWSYEEGDVQFEAQWPANGTRLVEIRYRLAALEPVTVHRRGFRNRCLRLIAEFRDLTLPRSRLGRLLTRKYYRQGKHRPTLRSFFRR